MRVAVESDVVNAHRATWLRAESRLEGHRLGATALRVLDDVAAENALVSLTADGAVRHSVFALDVGVFARRDFHLVDGHAVIIFVAAERGTLVEVALDALAV